MVDIPVGRSDKRSRSVVDRTLIVEMEMERTMTFNLRVGAQKMEFKSEGLENLELEIDGRRVEAAGVEHFFWYGVRQAIADGAAASKEDTAAEQLAKFQKRLHNLIAGTIRAVGERDGNAERREIATKIVVAALKKAGTTVKRSSDRFKELVAEAMEKYASQIDAAIAKRRAEEAELAELID